MRAVRTFVPLVFFALAAPALASCKEEKPKTEATPSASATSSAIPDDLVINSFFTGPSSSIAVAYDGGAAFEGGANDAAAAPSGPRAKVLEAGAEPRSKLAYALALGRTTTVAATISMSAKQAGAAAPEEPPFRFTLAITPQKKLPDGRTQVEFKVVKTELVVGGALPPQAAAQITALDRALSTLVSTFNVSPAGEATDLDFKADKAEKLPRGAEEVVQLLLQVFEVLFVPLPSEPVGVGAKWLFVSHAPGTDDDEGSAQSTFTLVSKGDKGEFELKVENIRNGGEKRVQDPRTGARSKIKVSGTSSFALTITLDAPTQKAKGESITKLDISTEGAPAQTQEMKMGLVVEPKGQRDGKLIP
jgi:hypothetical protein